MDWFRRVQVTALLESAACATNSADSNVEKVLCSKFSQSSMGLGMEGKNVFMNFAIQSYSFALLRSASKDVYNNALSRPFKIAKRSIWVDMA